MAASRGFSAVARRDARVVVLGTLPGQASLRRREYYAQPRNAFWSIMTAICGASPELAYPRRLERLVEHGIALWDVCASADRPGSLDASIRLASVATNDFESFFAGHGGIAKVCFNGAKAAELYRRRVQPVLSPAWSRLPLVVLPSTSPAHAAMSFQQKLRRWSEALLPG